MSEPNLENEWREKIREAIDLMNSIYTEFEDHQDDLNAVLGPSVRNLNLIQSWIFYFATYHYANGDMPKTVEAIMLGVQAAFILGAREEKSVQDITNMLPPNINNFLKELE